MIDIGKGDVGQRFVVAPVVVVLDEVGDGGPELLRAIIGIQWAPVCREACRRSGQLRCRLG